MIREKWSRNKSLIHTNSIYMVLTSQFQDNDEKISGSIKQTTELHKPKWSWFTVHVRWWGFGLLTHILSQSYWMGWFWLDCWDNWDGSVYLSKSALVFIWLRTLNTRILGNNLDSWNRITLHNVCRGFWVSSKVAFKGWIWDDVVAVTYVQDSCLWLDGIVCFLYDVIYFLIHKFLLLSRVM